MTIEQLSENKLKITLLKSELSRHEISPEDISHTSAKMKNFLVYLVRCAAKQTDFEPTGHDIKIESHFEENLLVFFITKLSAKHPSLKVYKGKLKKNPFSFFIFDTEKDFACFFSQVLTEDFSSSALYSMNGRYYFKTIPESRMFFHALEFANPVYSGLLAVKLSTSGRLVCKGKSFYELL